MIKRNVMAGSLAFFFVFIMVGGITEPANAVDTAVGANDNSNLCSPAAENAVLSAAATALESAEAILDSGNLTPDIIASANTLIDAVKGVLLSLESCAGGSPGGPSASSLNPAFLSTPDSTLSGALNGSGNGLSMLDQLSNIAGVESGSGAGGGSGTPSAPASATASCSAASGANLSWTSAGPGDIDVYNVAGYDETLYPNGDPTGCNNSQGLFCQFGISGTNLTLPASMSIPGHKYQVWVQTQDQTTGLTSTNVTTANYNNGGTYTCTGGGSDVTGNAGGNDVNNNNVPPATVSLTVNGAHSLDVTPGEMLMFNWNATGVTNIKPSVSMAPDPAFTNINGYGPAQLCNVLGTGLATNYSFNASNTAAAGEALTPFYGYYPDYLAYSGSIPLSGTDPIVSANNSTCATGYIATVTLAGTQGSSNTPVKATVTLRVLAPAVPTYSFSTDGFRLYALYPGHNAPGDDGLAANSVFNDPQYAVNVNRGQSVTIPDGTGTSMTQSQLVQTYPAVSIISTTCNLTPFPTLSVDSTSLPQGITASLGSVIATTSAQTAYGCNGNSSASGAYHATNEFTSLTFNAGQNANLGYNTVRINAMSSSGQKSIIDYVFYVDP